jgi:hypothetical protein
MGAIIMRWLRVVLPFAIVRGVKRADEEPRGEGVGEAMIGMRIDRIRLRKMRRKE